ncbi:hypothetical protein VTI28DRAFT_10267 [Corynascus sepedonium]
MDTQRARLLRAGWAAEGGRGSFHYNPLLILFFFFLNCYFVDFETCLSEEEFERSDPAPFDLCSGVKPGPMWPGRYC